jgi:CO/xanthine dehydrogenase Mo-binding subunit
MELEKGKVKKRSFAYYKIPSALDAPEMVPIIVEEAHSQGPYGAKGFGEPALAPMAAAIANAIYAAVGVRIKDLPITPERILEGLKKGKK